MGGRGGWREEQGGDDRAEGMGDEGRNRGIMTN